MSKPTHLVTVKILFKNLEGTDALKNYATEKLTNSLQKFVHHDTIVHTVLKVEKTRQICEVSFHVDSNDFKVSEESDSLYTSIDLTVDRLQQQLRKHKEKLTSHRQ